MRCFPRSRCQLRMVIIAGASKMTPSTIFPINHGIGTLPTDAIATHMPLRLSIVANATAAHLWWPYSPPPSTQLNTASIHSDEMSCPPLALALDSMLASTAASVTHPNAMLSTPKTLNGDTVALHYGHS